MKRRIKGKTARRFDPNIQIARTVINGTSLRLKVCTSCLKRGKVEQKA
jgi:large subunit ribosomal protein L28